MKTYKQVFVLVCLLLWTANSNQLMKVSLTPSGESEPKVALCIFKEPLKGVDEKSEKYFKELRSIVPLVGYYLFNTDLKCSRKLRLL
jgi:hypothetical protein